MAITDAAPDVVLDAAPMLTVVVRPAGVHLPRYEQTDEVRLDLPGLRFIEALAAHRAAAALAEPELEPLITELELRGLLRPVADEAVPPGPARRRPYGRAPVDDIRTELVMPTPVLFGCGEHGFEYVDHDGGVRIVLDAKEVLAAASFRLPHAISAALAMHRSDAGDGALDKKDFRLLVRDLVAAGVLVAFDPEHPVQARLTRQAESMREDLRRMFEIHANFDRLEAEHDAAGGPAERTRVIGFHTSFSGLPASLGMILAAAKGHEDGMLEESFDFRPRLLWDTARLQEAVAGPPGIFLFSNYVWSSEVNLEHSALVKAADPRHVTLHGGPDTPKYAADVERFFAEHPHVDIAVHGEGEATFVDLLLAMRGSMGDGPVDLSVLADVPGLSYRTPDGVVTTASRDRIADVNTIPSPVLMGLYDAFIPAGKGPGGVNLESNRGCPYGCTFCDWGSATLSRIRKFDLDRVFAELEWCAEHGFKVMLADANFGIFERDVDISQKIADLKAIYGYPRFVGNNYAKNTVKHLSKIIEIFTEAGIVAEGKMSMQSFDDGTLATIRRKNIKVERYNDLSVEFRRNELPMSVDLMMGLPGSTPESFRTDLQACIDRDLRAIVHSTVLLPNSPMNEPEYRAENGIVAVPGEDVRQTATFTEQEWDTMFRHRLGFWLFENFGVLRQVGTYVHAETGRREVDFYCDLVDDVHAEPDRWPSMAIALKVVPDMMVPPVSWRRFMDEVHRYLTTVTGVADDSALAVVLEVQHALLPARGRSFPIRLELAHDYAAWHRAVAERRDAGDRRDWHLAVEPLRSYGSAPFDIDDPLESCERSLGGTYAFLSEDSAWDLESPVARPRQAMNDIPIPAEA